MSNYNEIVDLLRELNWKEKEETILRTKLVATSLIYSGYFFKKLFSNVLGLEWLLDWSYKLKLPKKSIEIPSITYDYFYPPELVNQHVRNYGLNINAIERDKPAAFVKVLTTYEVNPINFPLVFLNYVARNLGKLVGWTLVAPVTILLSLGIRAFYGIQNIIKRFRITRMINTMTPEQLANKWSKQEHQHRYLNNLDIKIIAKRVDSETFLTELFEVNSKKAANNNFVCAEYRVNAFKTAREATFEGARLFSLVTTVLSSIFLIPLFWTIKNHLNLIEQQNKESALLEKTLKVTSITLLQFDLYSHGMAYLKGGQPYFAFKYFSNVAENHPYYKNAMFECGAILLADKQSKVATEFFNKAEDHDAAHLANHVDTHPSILTSRNYIPPSKNPPSLAKQGLFSQPNPSPMIEPIEEEKASRMSLRGNQYE